MGGNGWIIGVGELSDIVVASAGHVNADAHADFLITAVAGGTASPEGQWWPGAAYLFVGGGGHGFRGGRLAVALGVVSDTFDPRLPDQSPTHLLPVNVSPNGTSPVSTTATSCIESRSTKETVPYSVKLPRRFATASWTRARRR